MVWQEHVENTLSHTVRHQFSPANPFRLNTTIYRGSANFQAARLWGPTNEILVSCRDYPLSRKFKEKLVDIRQSMSARPYVLALYTLPSQLETKERLAFGGLVQFAS